MGAVHAVHAVRALSAVQAVGMVHAVSAVSVSYVHDASAVHRLPGTEHRCVYMVCATYKNLDKIRNG